MRSAIFLDKDGTLVEDVPFNVDPARIRWTAGAHEGVRRLAERGYAFAVVSNQSGVALGKFPEQALGRVALALEGMMHSCGAMFLGFYYCPHHPAGTVAAFRQACGCRKPQPGLLQRVLSDHHIDPASSWMVGDVLDDIEAGNRAGLRTILVDNGNEHLWEWGQWRVPVRTVRDLAGAAEYIIRIDGRLHNGRP